MAVHKADFFSMNNFNPIMYLFVSFYFVILTVQLLISLVIHH